jgi:hypothetical protein
MTGVCVFVGVAALSLPVPGSLPVLSARLTSAHFSAPHNQSAPRLLHAVGPCTPTITDVSAFTPGEYPNVRVQGTCFGTGGAFQATDSLDLSVTDLGPDGTLAELGGTSGWQACSRRPAEVNQVTCTVSHWTNTAITLASFSGLYGSDGWAVVQGDKVAIQVWNAQTSAGPATVLVTAAGWHQVAEVAGSDTANDDQALYSVAVSGTTVVAGDAYHASQAGRAYAFTKASAGWQQAAELVGSDTAANDDFGWSVAASGGTIVVGAPGHGSGGRAYVFAKAATGSQQAAELIGSDTAAKDTFGYSVAVSGSTIVVGAPGHGSGAGAAYVFSDGATGWQQAAKLVGPGTAAGEGFGFSVAVSGSTIVVGAPDHGSGAGAAYVFTKEATGWQRAAELVGSGTAAKDYFGLSVAVSGSTIVVGGPLHSSKAGEAYVYTDGDTGWQQAAKLVGSDTAAKDGFGVSVAVSGSTIVVGAPGHGSSAGATYVFTKAAAGWQQAAELVGSDTAAASGNVLGDGFGYSVAISGNRISSGDNVHVYVFGT